MATAEHDPRRNIIIPNAQLRQLANLLNDSARILEKLLSAPHDNGEQRVFETDLEKQLVEGLVVPDGASVRSRNEGDGGLFSFRTSAEVAAEEERSSRLWMDIFKDEHKRGLYEQLANVWTALEPVRDLDEVLFQRLYPVLLSSCHSYSSINTLYEIGPLLALLKRRRQKLTAQHMMVDSSEVSPSLIGIVLDDCFKQSTKHISRTMDEVTVETALDLCHRRGAMPPIFSRKSALEQIESIVNVIQIVNLTKPRVLEKPAEYYSQADLSRMSIKQALNVFTQGQLTQMSTLPRTMSISFRSRDFNARLIREIGRLSVKWTEYLDRHLELDVESMTLYVFWFGSTYFCDCPGWWNTGRVPSDELMQRYPGLASEVVIEKLKAALGLSYSILFTNPTKGSADSAGAYKSMPVPSWIEEFYIARRKSGTGAGYRNMGHLMHEESHYPADVKRGPTSHIGSQCPVPEAQTSFSRLGPFEDRMRILDAYMKSKKPNTLRGLWRDKRDSLQWWTLWVVIIFGGLSLLIGFLGVAISAAQTVAAFRQLEQ